MNAPSVLITGASHGIGKALAFEYARRGARLMLCARSGPVLRELAEVLAGTGAEIRWQMCDVAVREQMHETIDSMRRAFGRIDIAILNAGIGGPEWMMEFYTDRVRELFEVNVFGAVHALEKCIPIMKEQGGGVIAGISSLSDVRGFPGSAAYCGSKAALTRILESSRVELRQWGIRVVTVRPGFVRTAMTKKNEFWMPQLMSPAKAARIIVRGIERGKFVVRFPALLALVSEFVRFLPRPVFDTLARRARPVP